MARRSRSRNSALATPTGKHFSPTLRSIHLRQGREVEPGEPVLLAAVNPRARPAVFSAAPTRPAPQGKFVTVPGLVDCRQIRFQRPCLMYF